MAIATASPKVSIDDLRGRVRGPLLVAGDAGYDTGRRVWNGMIDKHPDLIVQCAGVADVLHAVEFARTNDVLVAVRGGGHSAAGLVSGGSYDQHADVVSALTHTPHAAGRRLAYKTPKMMS